MSNPDARRDYTDVRDVVRAYRLLAERAEPGVYNVCSGRTASSAELVRMLGLEHEVDPALLRPHEVMELRGSYEKLHAATGWEPEYELAQTLQDTVVQVIEQQLNGIDNLDYLVADAQADGSATITLTFAQGTNPDTAQVEDLKARYRQGKVGDVEVKTKLAAALNAYLAPMRGRREALMARPSALRDILFDGSRRARAIATETMERVRGAVKLQYT